jgi:hypothetical protein
MEGLAGSSSIFLSPYVLDELLAFVAPSDIPSCALVCSAWARSARKEYVWFRMAKRRKIAGVATLNAAPRQVLANAPHYYIPAPLDAAPSWRVLVLRNFCIHLSSQAWCEGRMREWRRVRDTLENSRCSRCNSLQNWMCTSCELIACGRTQQKHMLAHNEESRHPLVIQTRELQVWCFVCDRYVGEVCTAQPEERLRVLLMQHALLIDGFHAHRTLKPSIEAELEQMRK